MNVILTDPAVKFPKFLFLQLLEKFLPGQDIAKCLRISKKWNEIISNSVPLKKKMVLSSKITVGPDQWSRFGSLKNLPPLPENIKEQLQANCPYVVGSKKHQTHKLILFPDKIGETDFSLPHFKTLIEKRVDQKFPKISDASELIEEKKPKKAPYWALITLTDQLPQSGHSPATILTQGNLVKTNYTLANPIEGLVFVTFKQAIRKNNSPPKNKVCRCTKFRLLFLDNSKKCLFSCYDSEILFKISINQNPINIIPLKAIAVRRLDPLGD